MIHRSLLLYSTPIIQVLIGLCMGVAFSIILAPFLDNPRCKFKDLSKLGIYPFEQSQEQTDISYDDVGKVDYEHDAGHHENRLSHFDYNWNNDDYEPRIKMVAAKGRPSGMESSRRPRYISTELGIREKLFVAVLTSKDTLDTNGVALNRTLSHQVTKSVFFMNTRKPTLPSGMSLVVFNEEKPHSTGLQMISFIGKQYVNSYDWFFLLDDTVYVRGKKLYDLVSGTSVHLDVVLGNPQLDSDPMETNSYCDLHSGILLSQSMMSDVVRRLDWCQENLYDRKDSVLIGKCIRSGTKRSCSTDINGVPVSLFLRDPFTFSEAEVMSDGRLRDQLMMALTVARIETDTSIYQIHRFYCEEDLKKTKSDLERVKTTIASIAPFTPDVNTSFSWPLGVEPPTLPKTRFDVILWDYFTEAEIYLDGHANNVKELKGVDKEDITDVMKVSMEELSRKYAGRYTYRHLVNGYRRFDAARGMDYIMDLGLYDRTDHIEVTKRVRLLRPLGYAELVQMPYVTENSRVNLILPVTAKNRDSVVSFLDSYAHTCLESGDNTYLFVVFIYAEDGVQVGENDKYSVLKSMISFYENKYQNGARIAWTVIQNNKPSLFTIMDTISRKFSSESLFLLCGVGMELSIEFLNRVRMNTIANWQVFFPIAFWQYKPNLVHEEKPYPTTIEIDQKVGHFDQHSFSHAGFYNSDYQDARKQMISTASPKDIDLFDMFMKFHTLHIFRAVEPALKFHYQEVTCDPRSNELVYQRCLRSRGSGLASQAQLAMLIFENQQRLDQLQMNVMHKQNGPIVGQMKPDMLR